MTNLNEEKQNLELKGFFAIESELEMSPKGQSFADTLKKAAKSNTTLSGACIKADKEGNLTISFPEAPKVTGIIKREDVTIFSPEENEYLNEHVDLYDERKAKLLNKKCSSRIGLTLQFKVKSVEEHDGVVIAYLNRREVVEAQRKNILEKIQPGNVCKAVVTGAYRYGVFVDIGWDIQGLINIRDLCHNFVSDPTKLFKIGEQIDVIVKSKRENPFEIDFTRLPLTPNWEDIDKYYKENDVVMGTVGGKINTGVFIRLDETFEGLVNYLPLDKFKEGDPVKVLILKIDPKRHRIVLKPLL